MDEKQKIEMEDLLESIPGDYEFRMGVTYREAIDILNKVVNNLYSVINALQDRVLDLEVQVSDLRFELLGD